jgi:hypothetical protein
MEKCSDCGFGLDVFITTNGVCEECLSDREEMI